MLKVVGQDRSNPVIWTLKVSLSPDVVFTGQDAARTGVTETTSIISTAADKAKSARAEDRRALSGNASFAVSASAIYVA